ncbi:MAG: DNA primase [Oscillospiraceae bacterium]|nr:DNA primase [Oscillospiraceae bacterium]
MAFPREFMDELLSRSDIVSVVSRYVSLSKRGAGYLGLCPFHNEKTPSFSVSSDKQFFHCFGCGVGGDVISFVQRIENLEFADAVTKLAEWAGLEVPQSSFGHEERDKRKRALEASRAAARFFHEALKGEDGERARKYLLGRGLSPATITRFGLGYSPEGWSNLLDELVRQGYTKAELLAAGLVTTGKTGNIYDRFRDRAMFPIIDARGSVIGFGGRIMGEGEPKYLNSPESAVFNKRKNLYALNLAKSSKAEFFILAEGYMDVIALHQAGFDSAVASLGTSLTDEQAHLMSKYKNRVVIAYDSDGAGRAATERAIDILKRAGLDVRVIVMSGAKDPDEYIKKFGPDKYRNLIEGALPAAEYRLAASKQSFDLSDDKQRVLYIKAAVSQLAKLENAVEREVYAGRIAKETNVSRDAILDEAARERKRILREREREEKRKILDPVGALMPKERGARYKNARSAVAEEAIISLTASDLILAKSAGEKLSGKIFSSELLGRVFDIIYNRARNEELETDMSVIAERLSEDEVSHIATVFARNGNLSRDALSDYIETVLREHMRYEAENDDAAILAAAEFYRKKKGQKNG